MGFPQFANIDSRIYKTMVNRAGNNKGMSELQPWIRVTSTLHEFLTLESIKNTQSIRAVVKAGKFMNRAYIDSLQVN